MKKAYIMPESHTVTIGRLMQSDPTGETTDLPVTSAEPIDASMGQGKQYDLDELQPADSIDDWRNTYFKGKFK